MPFLEASGRANEPGALDTEVGDRLFDRLWKDAHLLPV